MANPKMIPVVDPETGKTGYIDPKYAPEAQKTGLQEASRHQLLQAQGQADTEATRADLNAQYDGTIEGAVAPALAGAARGLTLGGSDVVAGHLGAGVRKRLLDYQDYAPGASAVGEIGGVLGGALLGDEAGLGMLPGAVSRLGERVAVGAGERLGGGVAARLAGKAAAGAVEGAIYAGGKAEGDAALQNAPLTTEKALSAMGHGALFGAGTNVLLGGAGAGLSKLMSREEGAVASTVAHAEGREATGLGDYLQKNADAKTIKALGGSSGDISALERNTPGGFRRVAQDIRSDVESSTGRSIGFHNKESLHAYASKRVEELGDKLGGMLKKLDESKSGVAPDVESFARKVNEELIAPNVTQVPAGHMVRLPNGEMKALEAAGTIVKPGQGDVVKAATKWLDEVGGAYGGKPPTFTEWQQARVALDKQINFAARNASPEMGALKQIRGLMEKELEVSGEAAAKNVGGAFADEYQATKSLYQSVRKAQDLTERGVARELANNSFGLGATIGAATGIAAGGPIGGIAMGLAGKVIKDRGDMMAADLLHRAANLAGVTSLAARTDATIAKGVAGLLGAKAPVAATAASVVRVPVAPLGVALSGNLHKDFDRVSNAITEAKANPVRTTDKVARALGPEAGKNPAIASAATQLMLGDIDFLHKQLPPPRNDPFSLQPHLQTGTRASDTEKGKLLDQAKVIASPTIVLDKAANGTLSRHEVEALKERRPEMYEEIRTEVFRQVTTTTKEIPYDRRIQLGILLDIPTDRTLSPDFLTAIQATFAAPAGDESPPPQAPLEIANGPMTSLQHAMAGLEK